MLRPCRPQKLPLAKLDWERFADVLGKAHAALARFTLLVPKKALPLLRQRELNAQVAKERKVYQKALLFSEKVIGRRPLSSSFLQQIHKILQENQKGAFRTKQNWIGPKGCTEKTAYFLPPAYRTVPASMKNLEAYGQQKEKDPLVQLAIYFAQLLIIHPFMDGNGRLARALIPLFLYRKKLIPFPSFYLSAYFRKHRLKYFEKLYLISKAKDWEGWIHFFLKGIIEESQKTIRLCSSFSSSCKQP